MRMSIHERGEYLSDIIFSASDGIITTFAVVAGSAGALLDHRIVLILGFANLFADGFSMASGSYIGVKSEIEYEKSKGLERVREGSPLYHGILTFLAFNIAGSIPLIPFIFKMVPAFGFSILFVLIGLFTVGFLRNIYTKKGLIKCVSESLIVGGVAASFAFLVGNFVERIV